MIEYPASDLDRANRMLHILLSVNCIGIERITSEDADYKKLRNYFLSHPKLAECIPQAIQDNDSIEQFLQSITPENNTEKKRCDFIDRNLKDLFKHIESNRRLPSEENISNFIDHGFDSDIIRCEWHRAIERISSDPEGAITLARTILESVCRHILDEKGIEYKYTKGNLHQLYNLTATELNIHPHQHAENAFKTILESGTTIVTRIGELRNKLGDAHGTSSESVKPSAYHAEFAVNLAGITALFLMKTYKTKEPKKFSKEQIEIMKRLMMKNESGEMRIHGINLADLLRMEVVELKHHIKPLVDGGYVTETRHLVFILPSTYSILPKGKNYLIHNGFYERYH